MGARINTDRIRMISVRIRPIRVICGLLIPSRSLSLYRISSGVSRAVICYCRQLSRGAEATSEEN